LLDVEARELNGHRLWSSINTKNPRAALLLGVAAGKIQEVFFHADASRLGHLGGRRD
jgi:hypothetical protein